MRDGFNDLGHAENQLVEAIVAHQTALPRLKKLARQGMPGAFEAYRLTRQAEQCSLAAAAALNSPDNKRAA